jgi:hypothetical protein
MVMSDWLRRQCTAFEGPRRLISGELAQVVLKTKDVYDRATRAPVLIFDNMTSEQIDVDFSGSLEEVLNRLVARSGEGASKVTATSLAEPTEEPARGPGRPRLGVVAREVTLLPRHWEWLNSQPGGASVALRKLVDEARHANEGKDRVRRVQESAYRFMTAMAGDLSGFEEALRALFAGQSKRFQDLVSEWPEDIRTHVLGLVEEVKSDVVGNPATAL